MLVTSISSLPCDVVSPLSQGRKNKGLFGKKWTMKGTFDLDWILQTKIVGIHVQDMLAKYIQIYNCLTCLFIICLKYWTQIGQLTINVVLRLFAFKKVLYAEECEVQKCCCFTVNLFTKWWSILGSPIWQYLQTTILIQTEIFWNSLTSLYHKSMTFNNCWKYLVGKGWNAGNRYFLLFPTIMFTLPKAKYGFSFTCILLSAESEAFNLVKG